MKGFFIQSSYGGGCKFFESEFRWCEKTFHHPPYLDCLKKPFIPTIFRRCEKNFHPPPYLDSVKKPFNFNDLCNILYTPQQAEVI
jgi:hypothetical protein